MSATRVHRLLYVVGQLGGGGLERQLWYLLSAMDRAIYRPGVVVWNYRDRDPYGARLGALGVPVYAVARRGGVVLRLARLVRLVGRLRPELIHSYSFFTNFPAWCAGRACGAVVVGSIRNDYWADRRGAGRLGGALSSRFPSLLIANSRYAQQAAERHRSWSAPARVVFVANGIDLDAQRASPLPIGRRFEIIGVGRLYPHKAWDDLLRALAKLDASGCVDWRLRLCGEGPEAEPLRRLSRALGIDRRIEFLGFQKEVAPLLAGAHVFVLASRNEGTPNVVLEAMAAGRAIVATRAGDLPRLIENGREGFLVATGAPEAIAARLLELASDRALLERMGRAARQRVESESSLGALRDATFAAYRAAGWTE